MNTFRNLMLVGTLTVLSLSAKSQEPTKVDPKPLIKEGVQLYDKGDYKAAIEKYNQALKVDPENLEALYERAMSYMETGSFSQCMSDVEQGTKKDSKYKAGFLTLGGSCYSKQGQYDKAISYFQDALKSFPKDQQLHFNLAVAYVKIGKEKEARSQLKETLLLNPNRTSANYNLAMLYQKAGYRVPAMFMYLRFLMVEPMSERSKRAIANVADLYSQGAKQKDEKSIDVFFNPDEPTDEGDFGPLSIGMSISAASALGEEDKGQTEADKAVSSINTVVKVADELNDAKLKKTFVWRQSVEPLIKLNQANLLNAFLYKEYALLEVKGCDSWLNSHKDDIEKLQKWLSNNILKQ